MKLFNWFFDWGDGGLKQRAKDFFSHMKEGTSRLKNVGPMLKKEAEFINTAEEINADRDRSMRKILSYAASTIFFLALIGLMSHFIGFATIVGESMNPTFKNGQHIFINKMIDPEKGDIVVFEQDGARLIKRVVAEGGDTISIQSGDVYLNGDILDEPYIIGLSGELPETQVPEGCLFVMGDNREHSRDSRYFGPVTIKKSLVGVVVTGKGGD